MIDVCITNLGKYNEGTLDYERVTLPTSPEVIAQVMENIGIGDHYEEWFLSDWESEKLHCIHGMLGEYENLEELNYLANLLVELDEQNMLEEFDLVANDQNYSVAEAINSTQCLSEFYADTSVTNEIDLGYYLIELSGIDLEERLGKDLALYFDYEAYGISEVASGYYNMTGDGIYSNQAHLDKSFYRGYGDIPDEYLVFSSVENKGIEHLKNTELGTEENYNNIDGIRNNIKPDKDESKGKPSLLGNLKENKEAVAKAEKIAEPKEATKKHDDLER